MIKKLSVWLFHFIPFHCVSPRMMPDLLVSANLFFALHTNDYCWFNLGRGMQSQKFALYCWILSYIVTKIINIYIHLLIYFIFIYFFIFRITLNIILIIFVINCFSYFFLSVYHNLFTPKWGGCLSYSKHFYSVWFYFLV